MEAFKVDPKTGDIVLDAQNNIAMVEGDDELLQCVERIVTTNIGEWFLDLDEGLDRYAILGQKRYNEQHAKDIIVAAILQEPRIVRVESIEVTYTPEKRALSAATVMIKADGQSLEGEFDVN